MADLFGFFIGYDNDDTFEWLMLRWLSVLIPAAVALALTAAFMLGRIVG